jgi:IS1 family transposase
MNNTPIATRALILQCLTDGMSIRATSRITGAAKGTILRQLEQLGDFCQTYHDFAARHLKTTMVEADEQWSFVGTKQKNATHAGQGDIWTFCAIDSDSKLVINWLVGARTPENAVEFVKDLASRLAERIQLSTDGAYMYMKAVRTAFNFARCDYARLVKVFGPYEEPTGARRYSPAVCTGAIKERMIGRPDMDLVSTSYVERLNLNTRQNCRRFTRLTNGFSKKAENHAHAVALSFFAHNYLKAHGTLTKAAKGIKTTPAMASGLTDHVWSPTELLERLDGSFLCQAA